MKKQPFKPKLTTPEVKPEAINTLSVLWRAVDFVLKVTPKNIKSVLLYKY